eukprot:m.60682 g.60682  ORF g.60682 m.60682 type:complete len:63 (-) comp13857_c0_seq1:1143-1331(-)
MHHKNPSVSHQISTKQAKPSPHQPPGPATLIKGACMQVVYRPKGINQLRNGQQEYDPRVETA